MEKHEYISWLIIPLQVKANGVTQIDYKLPDNVKRCTGVALSVSDYAGTITSYYFGVVSLLFNNRKINPLHFQCEWRNNRFNIKDLLIPVKEELESTTYINGYYHNHLSLPHTMRIYLRCILKTNH